MSTNPDARNVTELMPALAAEFVEAGKAGGVSLEKGIRESLAWACGSRRCQGRRTRTGVVGPS